MNPYRILGAAANLFFIILFAIYLSLDTLENSLFPTEVILGGSVLLYGIAISALAICFGLPRPSSPQRPLGFDRLHAPV
ncbi:MAG: hypothetical protein IPH75_16225 [bacterium]|nr:hypothetical protein [bacterium]